MSRLCNLAVLGSLETGSLWCRREGRQGLQKLQVEHHPLGYQALESFRQDRQSTVSVCAWPCLDSSSEPRRQLPAAQGTGHTQRAVVALILAQQSHCLPGEGLNGLLWQNKGCPQAQAGQCGLCHRGWGPQLQAMVFLC